MFPSLPALPVLHLRWHPPQTTSCALHTTCSAFTPRVVRRAVQIDSSQVRDLSPLSTLPRLRKLALTKLNLEGGGEVDVSPLAKVATLQEITFRGEHCKPSEPALADSGPRLAMWWSARTKLYGRVQGA